MTALENMRYHEKLLKLLISLREVISTEEITFSPSIVDTNTYNSFKYVSINGKPTTIRIGEDIMLFTDEQLLALFIEEISVYLRNNDLINSVINNIRKEINHG